MKKLYLNKALLKKIFLNKALIISLFTISGILSLIIVILLFAGKIDLNNSIVSALEKGNRFYITNKYDKALEAYKLGLSKSKEDTKLNNNSAMASYNLKKYSDALTFLSKTPEKIEKFMKIGNSNFKLAEASSDANMKTQLFQKALEAYKQGIIKYPQDVDLKFNYEFVKKKLDEIGNKDNQNNQDDKKDQQKNEDKKDEQNKDNKENKDNKDQDKKDNQENKDQDNKDQNSKDQNEDKNDSKNQDSKQNNKQDKENSQDKNSQQQNIEQDKDKNQESNEDKKAQMNDQNKAGQSNKNMTEVQQVLQLLEQQEEESLKNNQGIKVEGKEAEHDW